MYKLLLFICLPIFAFAECQSGDCKNGNGTYLWPNGDKYIGSWKYKKMHGNGIFYFGSGDLKGDKYSGEFKWNKKNGKGVYNYENGSNYIGEFKNDFKNGTGTQKYSNGNKYFLVNGLKTSDMVKEH
tara:strand:+ start:306 stop:686 length:381 start_codon:yes stop_codon:yes gene_type:complete